MRALGHYIIIAAKGQEEKTNSGLILGVEDKSSMRYGLGEVISSGNEVTTVSPGDAIYYDTRNSFTMMVSGNPVTVIQERDVIIVEERQ